MSKEKQEKLLVNEEAKPTLGSGPRNYKWYQSLKKPSITPPQWVFPVVWTTLYIMIAISCYFYLSATKFEYTTGLLVFAIQVVLNVIWSPIFFWRKMIRLALVDIVLLWITVLITIILFYEKSHIAAYLLIPYITWLTLATYLNAYIAVNNPEKSHDQ